MHTMFVVQNDLFLIVIHLDLLVINLEFGVVQRTFYSLIIGRIFLFVLNCSCSCVKHFSGKCFQIRPLSLLNTFDRTFYGEAQVRQLRLFRLIVGPRNIVPIAIFLIKMN